MISSRIIGLTVLALIAFASNSILCRLALKETGIDAASFTTVRLVSGAITLWLLINIKQRTHEIKGSWCSASALFLYAVTFSYAYIELSTATGALLLFGAVQLTMISFGLYKGERFLKIQLAGFFLAFAGLIGLLFPGLTAPPLLASMLMIIAGIAWGMYSLLGKSVTNPLNVTAGNFLKAIPFTIILCISAMKQFSYDLIGIYYAVASGALASGIGYAFWYAALPALSATTAATVQLSVPVIAAIGGIIFLAEPVNLRLLIASVAILGGIALVIQRKPI